MSYSTINTHRSAIFMTGSHYLVQRLQRGVFNLRSPVPRYVFTWPVGQVLRYLKCLQGNDGLTLKALSMKTAVLLALVRAKQGATLTALNLKFISSSKNELRFIVSHLTKTSSQLVVLKRLWYLLFLKTREFVQLLPLKRTLNVQTIYVEMRNSYLFHF